MVNLKTGVAPKVRKKFDELEGLQLPKIKGTWFYVDPQNGASGAPGTQERPVNSIQAAYALCTSGNGDGIILLSGGTTTAHTTSYFTQKLDWTKYAITVIGVGAPVKMYGRARCAAKQVTSGDLTTLSITKNTTGGDTINDSANGFLTAGFEAGQTINLTTNSGTNDGQYTIASVTAGVITLTITNTLTTENAATAGSSTVTNYLAYLIDIQGDNNIFYNVHFGNFNNTAYDLGCIKVSGNRNYFEKCHFVGAGHATPGAVATAYDVLLDSAEEIDFISCTFGTDSVIKAAANGEVSIDGGCWRINFENCDFVCYSATAGKVAVKSVDADSFSGVIKFRGCSFINWNPNGITAIDDVFGGTGPTSGAYVVSPDSVSVGFTGWGGLVYVGGAAAAASAGGQIATIE